MFTRNTSLQINAARQVNHDGVDYLVVAGVPIREQVLNDYFVSAEEINRFIGAWNGIPVTINHPVANNGSANVPSPDVAIIGRFYNATWDSDQNRLTGEYWINLNEAMKYQQGRDIVQQIQANTILETSTGYWADEERREGEFNNRPYKTIHHHLRPDHIAIFPDGTLGACSNEDGCGVNLNSQKVKVFRVIVSGGRGSGHRGHRGRIGEQGGSEKGISATHITAESYKDAKGNTIYRIPAGTELTSTNFLDDLERNDKTGDGLVRFIYNKESKMWHISTHGADESDHGDFITSALDGHNPAYTEEIQVRGMYDFVNNELAFYDFYGISDSIAEENDLPVKRVQKDIEKANKSAERHLFYYIRTKPIFTYMDMSEVVGNASVTFNNQTYSFVIVSGGLGSGHKGHKGRLGEQGGSEPSLYHGTSVEVAKNIRKNGLDIKHSGDRTGSWVQTIWTTSNKEAAASFGMDEKQKGHYAIITLKPSVHKLLNENYKSMMGVYTFDQSIPPEYIDKVEVFSFKSLDERPNKHKKVKQFAAQLYVPVVIDDTTGDYRFPVPPTGEGETMKNKVQTNCGCDDKEKDMKPVLLNDVSLDRRSETIRRSFYSWVSKMNSTSETYYPSISIYSPDGIFETYIIAEQAGRLYKVDYTLEGSDGVVFKPKEEWEEVEVDFVVPETPVPPVVSLPVSPATNKMKIKQGGSLSLRNAVSKLRKNKQTPKEKSMNKKMKLEEFFTWLKGNKGISVVANENDSDEPEFEVTEETQEPVKLEVATQPAPAGVGLSPAELESLKKLAAVDFSALLSLPAQVEPVLQFAQNQKKEQEVRRNGLIARVKANSSNVFNDEELNALPDSVLQKLVSHDDVDYSGMSGATFVNSSDDSEGFLGLPKISFGTDSEVK